MYEGLGQHGLCVLGLSLFLPLFFLNHLQFKSCVRNNAVTEIL